MTEVVRMGDTLLVAVGHGTNMYLVEDTIKRLSEALPGVNVVAVAAEAFAIYRPEGAE